MKTLRQTCAAVILTMALAVSALAGDIYCPTATAPAPSDPAATSTEPGETQTPPSLTTTLILALLSAIS